MSLPLNQVVLGDCIEVMAEWPANSVDLIMTDPPYGIQFMGLDFDKALPPKAAFEQMIRVLKPGALAFVMSSPRQDVLWRMLSMLEGVGFELQQSFISWIYKTGFPKALDVSKSIDKKLGVKRNKILYDASEVGNFKGRQDTRPWIEKAKEKGFHEIVDDNPVSELAKEWEGWKSQTGLKPALECILMVNKPRSEPTIVDNVLRWGTGAVNVDACRIPFQSKEDIKSGFSGSDQGDGFSAFTKKHLEDHPGRNANIQGRFPANLLIQDGALDTGETTKVGKIEAHHKLAKDEKGHVPANVYGKYARLSAEHQISYGDEGSPFRFFDLDAWAEHHGFLDVAKPSRAERDFGLGAFPLKHAPIGNYEGRDLENPKNIMRPGMQDRKARNTHATVKPVKLMAYLIELGCSPKGIVVDPFLGSGTTCIAAKKLRRQWIGIEINPEYAEIAEARINIRGPLDQFMQTEKPSLLERIRRVCEVEGACRWNNPVLKLKLDIHDRVIGGEDAEELSQMMRDGVIYSPRPCYYKPTS